MQKSSLFLSPSKLSVFKDCPRCFWLDKKGKIQRPEGIFPSLPRGMDAVLKAWFDAHRKSGKLPPELRSLVPGLPFPDLATLERWRNWRTGLSCMVAGVTVGGALDDLLVEGGCYSPLDFKTKGGEPKDDGSQYYGHQLDIYGLMLERSAKPLTGRGYLVYFWPTKADRGRAESSLDFSFGFKAYELVVDVRRAEKMIQDAVDCLSRPLEDVLPGPDCHYCPYTERIGRRASANVT